MVNERRTDSGLWRDIEKLAALIAVATAAYTLYIWLSSPEEFIGWLNTLFSTLVSVFFALVVGLLLFQYQTKRNSLAKKADLTNLLRADLGDVRRMIEVSRTIVSDEALETTETSFTAHKVVVTTHYVHPLIVEEAARSGLFDEDQVIELLALARNMRAHNVRVQEVNNMRTQMDMFGRRPDFEVTKEFLLSIRIYAEAARSVQRSEDRIIDGCNKLLAGLEDG